jgi:hypothetical protein
LSGDKVLVVRAEEGRLVESEVVEGGLTEVVKRVAAKALEEWNPETSDFIVLRDVRVVTLSLPIPGDLVDKLRPYGLRRSGRDTAEFDLVVYTISFDNMMVGGEEGGYIERKIYLIAPYINEDLRVELEKQAVDIVTPKEPPEGIEELD